MNNRTRSPILKHFPFGRNTASWTRGFLRPIQIASAVAMLTIAGRAAIMVSPDSGPLAGGNNVTINTDGIWGSITNVEVGGVSAVIMDSLNYSATIIMPATGSAGSKDIFIQTSDNGDFTLPNAYTVNPAGLIGGLTIGPYAWTNLDAGVSDTVYYGLAKDGNNLYVGGRFTMAGGISANYIAMWNGTNWSALGSGMDNKVLALLHVGTSLYAAGDFTMAGGVAANHVAKWDGANWTPLGSGMNDSVYSLVTDGSNLYACGDFTIAGGVAVNHVAKWDGTAWTPLGSGMNDSVRSLAYDGTYLYAGGMFTTANGIPANYVAKWDGTSWTPLGSGMDSAVYALAYYGSTLYAGGGFLMADGLPANRVAKWNGASWTALGDGVDSSIFAFAYDGANLYVGGNFSTAGSTAASYVAKWDGASWSSLSTGVGDRTLSLLHDGTTLYAGGWFTNAGPAIVNHIAQWCPYVSEFSGVTPASGIWNGGYTVTIDGSNLGNGSDIYDVVICGSSVQSIVSQSSSQVVVVAGAGTGTGDVHVYSTSYGETVKTNGFTYIGPDLQVLGGFDRVILSGSAPSFANGTDFGELPLGESMISQYSITNAGTNTLNISGAAMTGATNFVLLDTLPASLAAGESATFRIQLYYSIRGEIASTLWLTNDSPDTPYALLLAGTGVGTLATTSAGATTWAGGDSHDWEINSATGTAGTDPGWDLLDITGTLNITATSGSKFNVNLFTLSPPDNPAGLLADFNNTQSYSWVIARASDRIVGFSPDRFNLNTAGFINDIAGGQLTLAQVGNEIHLNFSPAANHAPVAQSITAATKQNQSLTINASKLLSKASDADSDALTLSGVSADSASALVTFASGVIIYTPAFDFTGTDTFTYTISDGRGASSTATVTVTVTPAAATSLNAVYGPVITGGNFVVRFAGIPGYEYTIESTDSLAPASWVKKQNVIAPTTAGSFGIGVFEFTEPTGGVSSRFYRTVWPAY